MATAVFFHAHPDDESIATGGTMARLAAEGHRVVLVTATAGELGEVPEGFLEPGEDLASRRAKELAEACRILGVARHVTLGFGDSGMAGEPSNDRPGSFWRTDVDEAATVLAELLREEHADVVSAYDEHGGYGHPDHIQVHRVGLRAAEMAGTPRVFMATIDRTYVQDLTTRGEEFGMEIPDELPDVSELGVEAGRITAEIDVTPYLEQKRRAMEAHASQISETSFFLSMPPEAFVAMWGLEWFIEVGASPGGGRRASLLDGA
ncbi:MAG TPA: PIG-L family deacetylase [Acidimicrobiales bacterium]|nr:PIG-L family deacetylase [Acidimicrobiales bacterium]